MSQSLTFVNVTLTGKYLIWSECEEEWCTHCLTPMHLYENSEGQSVTVIDQHVVNVTDTSAPYYTRSQCSFFQGNVPNDKAVFFFLTTGASLIFENSQIDNIRVQAQSFIVALDQSYIGFFNTSIIRMEFASAFIEDSQGLEIVVEFDGAYITGFNRDQPYTTSSLQQSCLLTLGQAVDDVLYIRNSVFEYNFMLANTQTMLFIIVYVKHFEVVSSVFRSSIGGFEFDLIDSSTDPSVIRNVLFDSNHGSSICSYFQISGDGSLLVENTTFSNNLSKTMEVFFISSTYPFILNATIVNLNFLNNRLSDGNIKGVVGFQGVTSVLIDNCTLANNLAFDPAFPFNVFRYMLDNGLINDSPVLQEDQFSPGTAFTYHLLIMNPVLVSATRIHLLTSEFASLYGVLVSFLDSVYMTITDSSLSSFNSTEMRVVLQATDLHHSIVVVRNCDFQGPNLGGIDLVYIGNSRGKVVVEQSRFRNTGASGVLARAISVVGWSMNISNCMFENNQGITGSSVYFRFLGSQSTLSDSNEEAVYIVDSRFSNSVATEGGSDLYMVSGLSLYPLLLYIGNCTFANSTSQGSGGSIYLTIIAFSSIRIDNCSFTLGSAVKGGMIDLSYVTGAISLRDSSFVNILAPGGYLINLSHLREELNQETSVTLTNSQIRDCIFAVGIYITIQTELHVFSVSNTYESNSGIVIWNTQGTFSDSNSVFFSNSFAFSPCYYQSGKSTVAEFTGTEFVSNWATDTIGAVMVSTGSTANFTNCRFEQNGASSMTGVMQIEMSSKVTINGCEFLSNWATSAATLYLLEIDTKVPVFISDSVFIGNTGEGLLQLMNSNLKTQNVTIRENRSANIAGLILIQSNLSLVRSLVTKTYGTFGCVLYGVMDSGVEITESIISDIACEQESLFLFSKLHSQLNITESSLVRMSSTFASVVSIGISGQLILDRVQVGKIESPLAAFSLQNLNVSVTHSLFTQMNCTVLLVEGGILQVNASDFKNVTALTDVGAVNCTNCLSVSLNGVTFRNVSAADTAGVDVTQSHTVSVQMCRFEELTAGTYGALAVESDSLNITDSWFIDNKATGQQSYGGAVILRANSSAITGNLFKGNSATNGGAICWTLAMPVNTSNVFEGNTAVYGNDIASYAVKMDLINDSIPVAVSGQVFRGEIYVELLDSYGQVVKTDNSSIVWMSSNASLVGNLKGTASQGVLKFSQFTLTYTPNNTVSVIVSGSNMSFTFPIYLRNCIQGEILSDQTCELCQLGTYSIDAGATNCLSCLNNADCPGNSTLYPRPGFWRPDEWYNGLFECPRDSACLGSVNYTNNTGACADGYTGNMCQSCASNHTRDGKDICTTCLSSESYITGQTFLALGIFIFFAILVISSLATAENIENNSGVLFKLFLNHLHFIVLVAHFELRWPDELEDTFDIYEFLGNSGEQFIIWSCAQDQIYFKEIVVIAVLPAAIILTNLGLWTLVRFLRLTKETMRNLICSLTISLIFVHPLVVRVAFSIFRCITIYPNEHWLRFEMSLTCWDSTHLRYAFGAALPTLLLWGFGLPLGIALLFIKYRKQLKEEADLKQKLSFLCAGYRPSLFYWELVKVIWKVFIIVMYVFMSYENISLQALALCVLMWASAALQSKYSALQSSSLNILELRSIWVSIITAYSGIWFSSQALSYRAEIVLFALILIVHVYFFLLWTALLIKILWAALIKTHPQFDTFCPQFKYILRIAPAPHRARNRTQHSEVRQSSARI